MQRCDKLIHYYFKESKPVTSDAYEVIFIEEIKKLLQIVIDTNIQ